MKLALLASLSIAAPAAAQTTPAGSPSTTQDPAIAGKGLQPGQQQTTSQPTQANGPVARWQATNAVGKALRDLRADGVGLSLDFVTDNAVNPVGGIRKKATSTNWIDFGADLDLDKLVGLKNTRIHAQGASFGGTALSAVAIGNSIGVQQSYRPVRETFLTQLNIEHDFGKLNVMAGRAALNTYFFNSPLNCAFMSIAICLTSYGPIQTQGITGFPFSSWALKGRYAVTDRWYVQTGVFDYNTALSVAGQHGLDFSFFQGTGVMIPVEVGYQTNFRNDPLPRRYKVGFYLNTDGGTSPYYDAAGGSALRSGRPQVLQQGDRLGLYGLVDRTVAASKGGQRNTAVFARMFVNAGTATALDWSGMVGLLKTGTFAGRERDTIGAFVSSTKFSREQIDFWRDRRALLGGTGSPHRNEIVGEINYGFVPLSGFRLMPNVQYIINPDPGAAPKRLTNIPSAVVLGLRLDIRVQDLLGAPPPLPR